MRIVQMTSVHIWRDTRVFIKMCKSVAAAGHEVHFVVPREEPPGIEEVDGVTIHSLPLPANRRERMTKTVSAVLDTAAALKADLYQFHDPEILPRARKFQQRTGAPVVFDSHEDYRLQMMYKQWLPEWTRPMVGKTVGWFEDKEVKHLAGVIAATPSIAERFEYHKNCVVVQNFPIVDELLIPADEMIDRQAGRFGFVGNLSQVRGVKQMIAALPVAGSEAKLDLGGPWALKSFQEKCVQHPGWQQVNELGYMSRPEIKSMFRRVFAGLILLHPVESYLTAYPVKMFEYMAGGLPVIASDFPLWRSIIEDAGCGLVADPLDENAIGAAMAKLIADPDAAAAMGLRGQQEVIEKYNWDMELEKLLELYDKLV